MDTNLQTSPAQSALTLTDESQIDSLLSELAADGQKTASEDTAGEVIENLATPAGGASEAGDDDIDADLESMIAAGVSKTTPAAKTGNKPDFKAMKANAKNKKGKGKQQPAKTTPAAAPKPDDTPALESSAEEAKGDETPDLGTPPSDEELAAMVAQAQTPATTAPPAPPKRRITYIGNRKSVVLADRLNGKANEFLVLEDDDLKLEPEDLEKKQAEFMRNLDTNVAKKVAEKCIMLMKDLTQGNKVKNEVMNTAFIILRRDGKLTSGDQGNLQKALMSKYSVGTARSQANQIFCLFPLLKITTKEKGLLMPNPQSTILALVNGEQAQAE